MILIAQLCALLEERGEKWFFFVPYSVNLCIEDSEGMDEKSQVGGGYEG